MTGRLCFKIECVNLWALFQYGLNSFITSSLNLSLPIRKMTFARKKKVTCNKIALL